MTESYFRSFAKPSRWASRKASPASASMASASRTPSPVRLTSSFASAYTRCAASDAWAAASDARSDASLARSTASAAPATAAWAELAAAFEASADFNSKARGLGCRPRGLAEAFRRPPIGQQLLCRRIWFRRAHVAPRRSAPNRTPWPYFGHRCCRRFPLSIFEMLTSTRTSERVGVLRGIHPAHPFPTRHRGDVVPQVLDPLRRRCQGGRKILWNARLRPFPGHCDAERRQVARANAGSPFQCLSDPHPVARRSVRFQHGLKRLAVDRPVDGHLSARGQLLARGVRQPNGVRHALRRRRQCSSSIGDPPVIGPR